MRGKTKALIVGFVIMIGLFFVLGGVTSIIPNFFFTRMTAIEWYDYLFLFLTAILSGIYGGLWYYKKKIRKGCNYITAGGVLGRGGFGCAICNKLLVLMLGLSGVMTYFIPLQPILGIMSIGLLSYGVYEQVKI